MYKLIYLARRNPTVSRQDWPRSWRSHAKFAGRFPGLPAAIRYSRYCNRIDAAPPCEQDIDLVPLSTDFDGVAIACSDNLELLQGGAFTTEQFASILDDERRVFDRPTAESSFYCVESPMRDGPIGEAVLFMFLARQPAVSRMAFKDWLLAQHANVARHLAERQSAVTRYTCNLPLHVPPASLPFDVVIECWYDSLEAALQSEQDARLMPGLEDIGRCCDTRRSIAVLADVCNRWPLS
jgi:EthD domain-containing protein